MNQRFANFVHLREYFRLIDAPASSIEEVYNHSIALFSEGLPLACKKYIESHKSLLESHGLFNFLNALVETETTGRLSFQITCAFGDLHKINAIPKASADFKFYLSLCLFETRWEDQIPVLLHQAQNQYSSLGLEMHSWYCEYNVYLFENKNKVTERSLKKLRDLHNHIPTKSFPCYVKAQWLIASILILAGKNAGAQRLLENLIWDDRFHLVPGGYKARILMDLAYIGLKLNMPQKIQDVIGHLNGYIFELEEEDVFGIREIHDLFYMEPTEKRVFEKLNGWTPTTLNPVFYRHLIDTLLEKVWKSHTPELLARVIDYLESFPVYKNEIFGFQSMDFYQAIVAFERNEIKCFYRHYLNLEDQQFGNLDTKKKKYIKTLEESLGHYSQDKSVDLLTWGNRNYQHQRHMILKVLSQSGPETPISELSGKLPFSRRTLQASLKKMVDSGDLERVGQYKKTRYRLV